MRSARSYAGWSSGLFRPRLEVLEDRVYPGDALLGLWFLGLWASNFAAVDGNAGRERARSGAEWHPGLLAGPDGANSLTAVSLFTDSAGEADGREKVHARISNVEMVGEGGPSLFPDEDLARQVANYRLGVSPLPESQALLLAMTAMPSSLGVPGSATSAPFFAAASTPNEQFGGRLPAGLAVVSSPSVSGATLSFDASRGQLAIQTNGRPQTIQEAVTPDGFVDVTLGSQHHSSNSRSAAFDSALAGASAAAVTGVRFEGGGQDTLILGSQQLPGGLTVQAAGATVVTQDVAATGPLAIQAPDIRVSGAVQGNSIALAAPGWITVDATGRINAAQTPSRGRIELTAGRFINSGQLHADGATGGQIVVQAGNVLNAGPVTADGTGPGGSGGQVHIAFTGAYIDTTAAVISASSAAGPGGHLTIDGGSTGHLFSSGRQLATGSVGGSVDLFGRDVVLAGATVDASGEAGGGLVDIGSNFQGHSPGVVNARTITVTRASTIQANALGSGSGGSVYVGANQTAVFEGTASARGGLAGGPGGLIEVSGQGNLSYAGSADAGATLGKSGTLLLDPKNIIISAAPVGVFPQFDLIDPHPSPDGSFGNPGTVLVLSNGNIVVPNPTDDFGGMNAGAVYLFDGFTGALISSLTGSNPGDEVGATAYWAQSIIPLNNGNYVVESPSWNDGHGAVTWMSSSSGVSGMVSEVNSLVGSTPGETVGYAGSIIPLSNGNYLVDSPAWHGTSGAVTWGSGSTGVCGVVSEDNSLIGGQGGDWVGASQPYASRPSILLLSNGNYVINSPLWNDQRGAVTWGNGSTGTRGIVSAANSLVGSNSKDEVGSFSGGIPSLSNGNYVVASPNWNGQRGAVTWGDGGGGTRGVVSDTNSLVGSNAGDQVGSGSSSAGVYNAIPGVVFLSNGNYLVDSPNWSSQRGAVTWGSGSTGTSGVISVANSLVGGNPMDGVGRFPGSITSLSNGNYVVASPNWNGQRGAVT